MMKTMLLLATTLSMTSAVERQDQLPPWKIPAKLDRLRAKPAGFEKKNEVRLLTISDFEWDIFYPYKLYNLESLRFFPNHGDEITKKYFPEESYDVSIGKMSVEENDLSRMEMHQQFLSFTKSLVINDPDSKLYRCQFKRTAKAPLNEVSRDAGLVWGEVNASYEIKKERVRPAFPFATFRIMKVENREAQEARRARDAKLLEPVAEPVAEPEPEPVAAVEPVPQKEKAKLAKKLCGECENHYAFQPHRATFFRLCDCCYVMKMGDGFQCEGGNHFICEECVDQNISKTCFFH